MRLRRARRAASAPAVPGAAQTVARLAERGPAPLRPGTQSPGAPLRIAIVVPGFRRGSGGHMTLANLARGLERRGHQVSFWIDDPEGRSGGPDAFRSMFGPFAADVADDLGAFTGADVAVATGWQTVASVLLLEGCAARAYIVQDHEPEFYGASVERLWAEASYHHGLHCITASQWLAELVGERYGASATAFELGIDHDVYHPDGPSEGGCDVLFYARSSTPRRAVPLGLLALEQLLRQRPRTRIGLFGEPSAAQVSFPAQQLGVLGGERLAAAYRAATIGMVLSLTNHSLVAQEMAACGLAPVELDLPGTRAAFGPQSGITLAEPAPQALAAALARLLDDPEERRRQRQRGLAWATDRTWDSAALSVEAGLRQAVGR
jgi:glycosyltransferase involved in cell wall biosynthesis